MLSATCSVRRGGYRQFNPDAIKDIAFIKNIQQAGFSLDEILALLRIRSTALNTCRNVTDILDRKMKSIEADIDTLTRKRDAIRAMQMDCCKVNECN